MLTVTRISVYTETFLFILLSLVTMALPLKASADDGVVTVPPVRLSITAGTNSGIEQELVDYISAAFESDKSVVLSTVNPDWYVLCTVSDKQDVPVGQIRFNGTVTVKTTDGQIVNTTSAQKYNQDFSLDKNAPLNKQLVDSATREVISGVGGRAVVKIKEAVQVELHAREEMAKADQLANADKYDEAIKVLQDLGPDTVHFNANQKTIAQYKMEKHALELVSSAKSKAKVGRYAEAINLLKEVDKQSKRHKLAIQLSQHYRYLIQLAQQRAKKPGSENRVQTLTKEN